MTFEEAVNRAADRVYAAGNSSREDGISDVPPLEVMRRILSDQLSPEEMGEFAAVTSGLAVSLHEIMHEEDATCGMQVAAIIVGLSQAFLLGRIYPKREEPVTEEMPSVTPEDVDPPRSSPAAKHRPPHGGRPSPQSGAWDPYYADPVDGRGSE